MSATLALKGITPAQADLMTKEEREDFVQYVRPGTTSEPAPETWELTLRFLECRTAAPTAEQIFAGFED